MKNTTQTQMKTPKVGGNKTSIRFYEPLEPNGSEEAKEPASGTESIGESPECGFGSHMHY